MTRCKSTSHTWSTRSTFWQTRKRSSVCSSLRTQREASAMTIDCHPNMYSKFSAAPYRLSTSSPQNNSLKKLPLSRMCWIWASSLGLIKRWARKTRRIMTIGMRFSSYRQRRMISGCTWSQNYTVSSGISTFKACLYQTNYTRKRSRVFQIR